MAIHVAQMAGLDEKAAIFRAITENSAVTMGLEGYGLTKGCKADLVVLQARDPAEALRLKSVKLAVVKAGKVIARTAPREGALFLEGRPDRVEPSQGFAPDY